MVKHSPSTGQLEDPYSLLAITMLEEALRNIRCYYNCTGSKEEIEDGEKAVSWIRDMEGNFEIVAIAANIKVSNFHQMCLWKINKIKEEARRAKQNEKR